jgi:predicted amidohydrolase
MNTLALNIKELNNYGRKGKRGNLLGIEPYVVPEDYSSVKNLQGKLDGYLSVANEQGWINRRTVVLWPEYIGTWLFVSGETPAPTLQGVIENIAKAHQKEFNSYYATAKEQNKVYAALLRTKAKAMAASYQSVFSRLSRKYAVTTIAGSIALPSPQFLGGKLVMDVNGPLYNVSMVFDRKGRPYPDIVYKAYPTASELPYTTSAPVGNLPAYETPVGRLGILICADSWYPQAYARMKALKVGLIAVPSFGHGGLKAWTETWKGYDGWPDPPDVNPKDINRITNSKAWLKYSLVGRIGESDAAYGSNVFLHGNLWPDLNAGGGVAAVVRKDDVWNRENKTAYATLNNLWL